MEAVLGGFQRVLAHLALPCGLEQLVQSAGWLAPRFVAGRRPAWSAEH